MGSRRARARFRTAAGVSADLAMRTIGILGGIAPQATMDLEARIHRVAQQFVTRHANTGYPPLVTVYMRHPPVLVNSDGKPLAPLAIDPRVLDTSRRLGEWADFIVIPSNTPHLFLDAIQSFGPLDHQHHRCHRRSVALPRRGRRGTRRSWHPSGLRRSTAFRGSARDNGKSRRPRLSRPRDPPADGRRGR